MRAMEKLYCQATVPSFALRAKMLPLSVGMKTRPSAVVIADGAIS